jgi:cytochrome P450
VFRNTPHPFLEEAANDESSGMSELLISFDPPEHSKLRRLISAGFTPRRVADLEDRIRTRVDAIIDDLAEQDSCDLVDDLAVWLPLHVIADLVGVPEEDRTQVFEWTELTFGFDPNTDPDMRREAAMNMYAYADAMCQERQDDPRDDLMSVLLHAEVDGEQLTQLQVDLFFLLLQNAGSETTRNLITTGTMALIQNPDQLALVQSDLSVLPTTIEEMLRFASPVIQFVRRAEEDTEVAGQAIAKDDRLAIFYPSANRDHRVFDEPDRLDVTRDPNDHVAFGAGGPHHCLGANLARLEGRVMFESILGRFEGLELAADPADLTRVHSNLIDGFTEVPITWQRVKERVGA